MRKVVKRKNYYLDEAAIKQAQRVLGTKTETETIQKALELVVDEARLAQALKTLLYKGKGHIHDPAGSSFPRIGAGRKPEGSWPGSAGRNRLSGRAFLD